MKSAKTFVAAALCTFAMTLLASAQQQSGQAQRYPERQSNAPPVGPDAIRATFTVAPGQLIQAAVDRARPGDRIEVLPGVYHESLAIDLDNIELAGIVRDGERPQLDGRGEMNDAIQVSGHNFIISGFEIRDYKGNGVVVNKAQNVTFRDVVARNAGKYALYPVLCNGVLIEDCVVSDAWDAGIYAGQSNNVVIRNCEAYRNTIGIETENCINVLITNNSAHHNSLGILVVLLPDLPTEYASNARVIHNRVWANNHPNVSPPGNLVNGVQPGVGIAVNAADNSEVTNNDVTDNNSYGIALYSLIDTFLDREKFNVEPNPDNNYIHDNRFAKNGSSVNERFKKFGAPGGDLFWSGKGTGNGFSEQTESRFPAELPTWPGAIEAGGGE